MLYQNPHYKESMLKFIDEAFIFPTNRIELNYECGTGNEEAVFEAMDKHNGLIPVFRNYDDKRGILCRIEFHYEPLRSGNDETNGAITVCGLMPIKADEKDNAKIDVLVSSRLLNDEYNFENEMADFRCDVETLERLLSLPSAKRLKSRFRVNNATSVLCFVYKVAAELCEENKAEYSELIGLSSMETAAKIIEICEKEQKDSEVPAKRLRFKDMEEACEYILRSDFPVEVKELAETERLNRDSYGKMLYFFTYLANFPWNEKAEVETDLLQIAEDFDKSHYGMKEVKERIIESLIVKKRTKGKNSPILCLVGSPGVGKTSFAKAIAKAMKVPFQKISMSGSNDTHVLKGSNKTYVGAAAGAIVNALNMARCMNPLILIDEIEKSGASSEGNPVNVLLEALDPSQNNNFIDDYMTIGVDLSEVTFVCTANYPELIPAPLRDRMEIIEMPDYSQADRITIFKDYVIPAAMKEHNLNKEEMVISDSLIKYIVKNYSIDGGIRNLERCAAKLCRKVCALIEKGENKVVFTKKKVVEYLGEGLGEYKNIVDTKAQVGVANAMAVNGLNQGLINKIECAYSRGSGKLNVTGNLSEMTKESCNIALEYVKCIADKLGIAQDFFDKHDINVHFTKTAIQKDGNSAGVAFVTAIISAITGRKTIDNLSMTGEISLIGNVSAIGGLRQKIEGAKENGITTIIYPSENQKDVDKLPKKVKKDVKLVAASNYSQILDWIFA